MTAPALDPSDLGTDVSFFGDIGRRWTLASGQTNLIYALFRRLSSDPGSLYYDPAYGFNLLGSLNGGFSRVALSNLQARIAVECRKDPRVQDCSVRVVANAGDQSLTVKIVVQSATGPFELVLRVSALTVAILNAGQLGLPAVILTVPTTPSFAGPPGPAGPAGTGTQGPPGPGGPAGTSSQSFSSDAEQGDSTGTELIWWQYAADLSAQPAGTLTADFTFLGSSASGTATFRLYVGGTFSAIGSAPIGGVLVATVTRNGLPFVALKLGGTFTNPTGIVPVVITIQSSGAGVDARGQAMSGMIVA